VPGAAQLHHASGRESDPIFVNLDFPWNADAHDASGKSSFYRIDPPPKELFRVSSIFDIEWATAGRFCELSSSASPRMTRKGINMNLTIAVGPVIALIAGILILIMPRLLNYIVAIYLIVIGLLGLFGGTRI
jgi:hypothetical protein